MYLKGDSTWPTCIMWQDVTGHLGPCAGVVLSTSMCLPCCIQGRSKYQSSVILERVFGGPCSLASITRIFQPLKSTTDNWQLEKLSRPTYSLWWNLQSHHSGTSMGPISTWANNQKRTWYLCQNMYTQHTTTGRNAYRMADKNHIETRETRIGIRSEWQTEVKEKRNACHHT